MSTWIFGTFTSLMLVGGNWEAVTDRTFGIDSVGSGEIE